MSFFGKKRRGSIDGSGLARYVSYAIGEIVLVVIGILLAIEINNWNEGRKDRESEQTLLKGLLAEMIGNRDELVKAMTYHRRSEDAAEKLTKIFHGNYHQYKSEELDSLLAEVQWAWTFDPRLGVLNSIKNSGKINVIQNAEIQAFITSFEESANDSREESITIKSLIVTQFMPIINQYVSANKRDRYLGVDVSDSKFPSDHEGLFNSRPAESIVGYIYFWRIDERGEEEELLARLNQSIALVREEVKN